MWGSGGDDAMCGACGSSTVTGPTPSCPSPQGSALPEAAIALICAEALKGLSYLHGLGKVHRDIKCGNILLTQAGQVRGVWGAGLPAVWICDASTRPTPQQAPLPYHPAPPPPPAHRSSLPTLALRLS